MKKIKSNCDMCMYFEYDEEYDEYACSMRMDEDEIARLRSFSSGFSCPYYRPGDEYKIVNKQIRTNNRSII